MLIRALWKLPASVRPKGIEAAAIIMTENPPLDRLEFRIGEPMEVRDLSPRPSRDP